MAKIIVKPPHGVKGMEQKIIIMAAMPGLKQEIALKKLEAIGYSIIKNCSTQELFLQLGHPSADHLVISLTLNRELINIREKFVEQKINFTRSSNNLTFLCLIDDLYELLGEGLSNSEKDLNQLKEQFALISYLRQYATIAIETTTLSAEILESMIEHYFDVTGEKLPLVRLISFSYRMGIPKEANLVFDGRFLPNPHYDRTCSALTGKDLEVQEFIERDPNWQDYSISMKSLIKMTLFNFKKVDLGKFITIACGCTGGQHRSVFMVEHVGAWLKELNFNTRIDHRDMPRN
ncbi:MAG: hypothetical protein KF820_05700 [Candidatus Paracaedibacteraceae bacterium]|nr:hypothetical protein [Candidatus Paracaedibacteraceae bacterium]